MAGAKDDAQAADARFGALLARRLEPETAVAELEAAIALHPKRDRTFRAKLLARTLRDAADLIQRCGWPGKIELSDGKVVVVQDGARFSADRQDRFFRTIDPPAGATILGRLEAFRIVPRTILDVGANIGELSIYFARRLPNARVIAFEPAPENLRDFEENLALQDPPLTNLELVTEAVSDRTGTIAFTVGAADLNTTMVESNIERLNAKGAVVVDVPTDTLENLCARLGVEQIDLLKVDTEGGEPRMAASIRAMGGRIRSAFVEMSVYNTLEAYADLIDAFAAAGMLMREKNGRAIADPTAWLAGRLATAPAVNVWFVQAELLKGAR